MDAGQTGYVVMEWMQIIGLGALVGAAGQCLRTVAGLKKLHDTAAAANAAPKDLFSTSQLVVSLIIGAVAGTLGAISLGINPADKIATQTIITLLGIGYAGADFIEAFMKNHGRDFTDGQKELAAEARAKAGTLEPAASSKAQPVG